MRNTIRDVVAGAILTGFVATYLAMEWGGREPDSIVLVATVAIVIGAGYHLWEGAMAGGVDAAQDLQASGDEADGGNGSSGADEPTRDDQGRFKKQSGQ